MEFSQHKRIEKPDDKNQNPVIQLNQDNWRQELLQSSRPVIVLTQAKDCFSCGAWEADLEKQAKEHPDFKFAISDAAQFGFSEKKAPIVSTIVPGIGTAFLQHVELGDEKQNQAFWNKRFETANNELRQSANVTSLEKSSRELLIDITKYGLNKSPHTPEETAKFEDEEKRLGQTSEALAQSKLEIISELKGEIDQSVINPENH